MEEPSEKPKSKFGRKKLTPSKKSSEMLTVKLTLDESEKFETLFKSTNLKYKSVFIRKLLFEKNITITNIPVVNTNLITAIHKIGINVNQIAMRLNMLSEQINSKESISSELEQLSEIKKYLFDLKNSI